MSNPYVYSVHSFETTLDGIKTTVGVDYDSVTIEAGPLGVRLTLDEAGTFASAFVQACWRAGAHREEPPTPEQQAAATGALDELRRKLAGDGI